MPALQFIFKKSLLICAIFASVNAFANVSNNEQSLEKILQITQEKNLANHTTWHRMLYFDKGESRVINRFNTDENIKKFFVNQYNTTDPQAEMTAMLIALFDKNDKELGDNSVQCRFPARTHWLKQQLNLTFSPANCQNFEDFLQKIQPKSVSLIFANEYYDNPASSFAHSFLRFDNGTQDEYYLNYTPKTQKGENMAKFAYKSTISGNAGGFVINHYHKSIEKYILKEERDIWQYRLNLTEEQSLQLARQVYEIKDQILPYYLFDENCASEILTLLNMLFPEKDYLANPSIMIAPSQIMRQLDADGLIAESHFVPAKLDNQNANHNNPLHAHALSRLTVGVASDNKQQTTQLGYRLVYHDMLDKPVGYPLGRYLTGLDIGIEIGEKNRLTHATLINLQNFKPANEKSWSMDIGLKQVVDNIDNNQHLVANTKVGYGVSQHFGETKNHLCYQLANVAMQVGKGLEEGYRASVGADFGCLYHFNDKLRGVASVALPYWFHHQQGVFQPNVAVGVQFDMGKNQAIRLNAESEWLKNKHLTDKIAIRYVKYFE